MKNSKANSTHNQDNPTLRSPKQARDEKQTWLSSFLLRHGQRMLRRFRYFYERLRGLNRRSRRAWQKRLRTTLVGAALLLALSGASNVHAASITVDGADCTLHEAITTANDGSAQAGCATGDGAGPDTIQLETDVTLSTALPGISSEITLNGNGHTIDGNNSVRVLDVQSGGDLTLNNATITGGSTNSNGGGIANGGILTLNESTISGNSSSGYGGGGVANSDTLTVNNSTISGNSVSAYYGYGGGIYNEGTLAVNNSTISGNSASTTGYGAYGGGLHMRNGTATLNRTVISGNSAETGGDEISVGSGTINADNYNLFGHNGLTNGAAFSGFTPGASDITATNDGTNPTALSSILNTTLADNGGPTLSHALVSGSPAIDAAPSAGCAASPVDGIDQRGAARSYGADCDIGAVEQRESVSVGDCGGSDLSGPQAFYFSNSGNTVTVDVNTANGLKCITIEEMGPGANHLLATGPGANGDALMTDNWWHITGNVASGFSVDLTLPYATADADSRVCKWPGNLGGYGWDCDDGTNTSSGAGTVTRTGITSFSDWAVGDNVGPTAVNLQNLSAGNEGMDGGVWATVVGALSLALGLLWRRLRG